MNALFPWKTQREYRRAPEWLPERAFCERCPHWRTDTRWRIWAGTAAGSWFSRSVLQWSLECPLRSQMQFCNLATLSMNGLLYVQPIVIHSQHHLQTASRRVHVFVRLELIIEYFKANIVGMHAVVSVLLTKQALLRIRTMWFRLRWSKSTVDCFSMRKMQERIE